MQFNHYDLYKLERPEHDLKAKSRELAESTHTQKTVKGASNTSVSLVLVLVVTLLVFLSVAI